jgi:hypothetical protein
MNRAGCPTLLHVVERPTSVSDDFDRAVGNAGFNVKHIDTVYGALARVLRPAGNAPTAVIVCLDRLEAGELEFFTLAAKLAPSVPVYVYGRAPDGRRQQRALSLGARSEVSADHIATVLASLLQEATEPAEALHREFAAPAPPPIEPHLTEPSPEQGPPVEVIAGMNEHHGRRVPCPPGLTGETPAVPARSSERDEPTVTVPQEAQPPWSSRIPTPWQPVSGRPQRVPPGAPPAVPPPPGREAPRDESLKSDLSPAEPLLTPQEIDALLRESSSPDEAG